VVLHSQGDAVAAIDQQDVNSAHWNNYASVKSAEETAAKAKQLGARILEEPFDVDELGRLAVLAGPLHLPARSRSSRARPTSSSAR
jgi:predicted enzyme related to lactoylglutathione lyase